MPRKRNLQWHKEWREKANKRGIDYVAQRIVHTTKCNSKNKKSGVVHEHTITKEDVIKLWEEQEGRCHYTGVQLDLAVHGDYHPSKLSVDRIDCSKGYTPDNIVLCTAFANLGRNTYNYEDFQAWLNTTLLTLKPLACPLDTTIV